MSQLVFGLSPTFLKVVEKVDQFARSDWPVLILGETGVGKELVANRIHLKSKRGRGPMVAVNLAAVPTGLMESELFGYEKGAFSGATQNYRGLFRQAHQGTLLLDEIGEMEAGLQAKLLRVIETKEVRPLGSARVEQVETRIISATNANLYRAIGESQFRRDLLERLGVLTIEIPPLRDRREDIALISKSLLAQFQALSGDGDFSPLVEYDWPGNVRQLRNVLARAVVMSEGPIRARHLEQLVLEESVRYQEAHNGPWGSEGSLEEIEKRAILGRLVKCHGNRKQTAKELGIAKSTLHEKLRRWGEMPPFHPERSLLGSQMSSVSSG